MMRCGLALLALAACSAEPPPGAAHFSSVEGRPLRATIDGRFAAPAPPASLAAWTDRAEALRSFLYDAARVPSIPAPPAARLLGTRQVDNVILKDLLLEGEAGLQIPALLYLPAVRAGPVPAALLNVGHDSDGQAAPYIRITAWTLARNGIAVLTTDWMGMGSRFVPDQRHVPLGMRSYLAGLYPTEILLGEPLAAFEYLRSLPEVDPDRVGIAGQSGGGMVSMYLAAMDTRIAAAVVIDITVPNEYMIDYGGVGGWGDPDSFVVGFHGRSSHAELLGLIAPRPLLVLTGDDDMIAPTTLVAGLLVLTRQIYGLYGAASAITHMGFPTQHCWCEGKVLTAVSFLAGALGAAPIDALVPPPAGTNPQARPDAEAPHWLDVVAEALATTPSPPSSAGAATAWRDAFRRSLDAVVAAEPLDPDTFDPDPPAGAEAYTAVLRVSDQTAADLPALDRAGVWTIALAPAGLGEDLLGTTVDLQRYLTQKGLQVGSPILRLGVEDIRWAADGARALGVPRVVAVCEGANAGILCLSAMGDDALDGMVVTGLPLDFASFLPLDQPLPFGYYASGVAGVATPDMLYAGLAPRPLAVPDRAAADLPFAAAVYGALGGDLALGGGDVDAAVGWLLAHP